MPKNKKYYKYALPAIAAAACMATTAPFVTAADTTPSFPDVMPGDSVKGGVGVHYDAIMNLAGKGIIDGKPDGKFYPWENVTRGQVAKMLVEVQGIDIPDNIDGVLAVYSDVDANNAYADYIAAATEADIFRGDGGVFGVYTFISRQQMASVLVRTFSLDDIDVNKDVAVHLNHVSATHKDAVQTLANLGLTTALPDFRAYDNNSRAGFASFLYRTAGLAEAQAIVDAATVTLSHSEKYTDVTLSNKSGLVWLNEYGDELVSYTEDMPRNPTTDIIIKVTATATIHGQTASRNIEFTIPKQSSE